METREGEGGKGERKERKKKRRRGKEAITHLESQGLQNRATNM